MLQYIAAFRGVCVGMSWICLVECCNDAAGCSNILLLGRSGRGDMDLDSSSKTCITVVRSDLACPEEVRHL